MPSTLILLRHGQSTWNQENRFTGWVDVDLSEQGRSEATQAGVLLRDAGYAPDVAFTSVLKRAIRTLWITLDGLDRMWIPVTRAWQLNERHYGALQGLDKAETAAKHGEDQVKIWRRSFDVPPPFMEDDDPGLPHKDPRYAGVAADQLPRGESLALTLDRVLPYWHSSIVPQLTPGRTVLVAAHGNSLRALVKHLEGVSDQDILELNIPTGVPRVYTLDDQHKPTSADYLGDPAAVAAAAAAVANQGKA